MVVVKPFNYGGLYGLESTYGTAVTASTSIGRLQSVNVTVNNAPIKLRGLGSGPNVKDSLFGPLDVRFSWEQELHDADIFKLAVGPKTGAGTSGSPYVMTEASAVSTTQLPFFTFEGSSNDTTDEGVILEGCVIESFQCTFAMNATARVSFNGVAESMSNVSSSQTYTEATTKPFVFHQITVKWGATPTALGRVVSGQVGMNNNLVVYRGLGSRFIVQPELGLRDYTFTLTVYMSETSYETLRTSFYGGTSTPNTGVASAAFPTTDKLHILASEGSSTGNRNIQFQLDEAVIDSMSQPAAVGSGLVQVTFNGHAHKGISNQPVSYWTA